jgi:hypothetical protein
MGETRFLAVEVQAVEAKHSAKKDNETKYDDVCIRHHIEPSGTEAITGTGRWIAFFSKIIQTPTGTILTTTGLFILPGINGHILHALFEDIPGQGLNHPAKHGVQLPIVALSGF